MKAVLATDGTLLFWCPGCDGSHGVPVSDHRWTWNGSCESPTLNPSILVRATRYGPDKLSFSRYKGPFPCEAEEGRCHSFVRDGLIEFLADSTHHLAGQTVPLPDLDSEESA